LTDDQLLRYSRHILLEDIGIEGQQRILDGHALIIGAGGLGSPAALYLGSAGVGDITVIDHDSVDLTNLQRQIAHTQARLGQAKSHSIAQALAAINPTSRVHPVVARADDTLLAQQVAQADVVLDCCDNFSTRQAINRACVKHHKPLVSGAAIRFDAQFGVYDPRSPSSPCYACVFPPADEFEETRCATMGVFAPLVGIIGAMQAAEALKLLVNGCSEVTGRLQMLDGRAMRWSEISLPRQSNCPVCGSTASRLN
jgi:molybdopterin-synthase adenylyltransferase